MDNEKLATELLREIKLSAKRWFVAFLVVTFLWFTTIAGFVWYITLPVEEGTETTTVENDDGNANYIGGSMSGVINNGEGKDNSKEND